ncbi:heme NO-binding domain-containing protein [Flexibacterium corallicola]|uniref:heme NO-binding domain-containing protein n=1 Tax=Flexibacterium corallicola TaxID=3037259 RepID=UPI00286EDADB|nr:heme NO-binding domain-containing protein [Pseudovibrio sp. M1P-2-3]
MLGIVFTEFIEMVEEEFSPDVADDIIVAMEEFLPSKGVYTAVGEYDHTEILQLVTHLSEKTNIPVADLVEVFGRHLFSRFVIRYPEFFDSVDDIFVFLMGIEDHIHREVRKLYPHAELPTFSYQRPEPNKLIMDYSSTRPFSHLALGLIRGASAHFGTDIELQMVSPAESEGRKATFTLVRR